MANEEPKKIAIIGAGISGLSLAQMLKETAEVTVFEQASTAGGLLSCARVKDNLFHKIGGHVFNSRDQRVLDWFWSYFDKEREFVKARRNAKILMEDQLIGYPIENHLYQLAPAALHTILDELLANASLPAPAGGYADFEAFLKGNFGATLYELYLKPYNCKIWRRDLSEVPLEWLEGKLPAPNLKQILLGNLLRQQESEMVHSAFYYPLENGSQFIIDRLSAGLSIQCNAPVERIERSGEQLWLNEQHCFDAVVYSGDLRRLHARYRTTNDALAAALLAVTALPSNSTSNVFCETDPTEISWLYLPDPVLAAHRIIYTGNFSPTNNRGTNRSTCVVEFTGIHTYEKMREEIKKLPGNLTPLAHNIEANSYIIHQPGSRAKVQRTAALLEREGLFLLGRFAQWEYFNMDACIKAAMQTREKVATHLQAACLVPAT